MAMSLEDLLAAGPSGGGAPAATQGPRPIGVPDDYAVPSGNPRLGVRFGGGGLFDMQWGVEQPLQTPRYMEGDEWMPASTSPGRIAELQQQMVDAGILKGKYRIGVWDQSSRTAYRSLLEVANGAGVDQTEALRMWSEAAPSEEEADEVRKPLIQLDNPEDLRRVFKAGARKVLGRKVDDATLDSWIQEFHGAQRTHQTDIHGMTQVEGAPGGTITDPQSAGTFAEDKAAALDPTKADARKVVSRFDTLTKMLGEGGVMNVAAGDIGAPA